MPFGPPVTFHLRRACRHDAMKYEQEWAAAGDGRMTTLSCTGCVTIHADGTECSEGPLCAGKVPHASQIQHYPGSDGPVALLRNGRLMFAVRGLCGRKGRLYCIRQRHAAGDWTTW